MSAVDPNILRKVGATQLPPAGKLFTLPKNSLRQESQCQWKGCHAVACREIARSNAPCTRGGYGEWWCFCHRHFEQALPMRREVLARFVDPIRLKRRTTGAVFR